MREANSSKGTLHQQDRRAASVVHHLVVVVAFCAVGVLWLQLFRMGHGARFHPSTGIAPSRQCSSAGCEEAARQLGRCRSPDRSPCVDFYEHVCGGYSGSKEARSQEMGVLRQTVIRLVTSVVAYNLAKPAPRLKQSASQKAATFLRACRTRTSRYEENLSPLKRFASESALFRKNENFNPLSEIAKHVFILGLPLFFQLAVHDGYTWRGRFLLCLELTPTRLWLKTQNAFRDKNYHRKLLNDLGEDELRTLIAWERTQEVVAASGVVPLPGDYTQWYCIERALRIYGHALTLPYILSTISHATLGEAGRVYANVKKELMRMANRSRWLRGSALSTAMRTVQQLTTSLVFPPALESLQALNELYQDTPNVNCPFLVIYLAGSRAYASRTISLTSVLAPQSQFSDPRNFFAVALYKRQLNYIFISAASAFPPSLDAEGPGELNYGFFGRVVAQAILLVLKQYLQQANATFRGKRLGTAAATAVPVRILQCLKDQALSLHSESEGNRRGDHTALSAQFITRGQVVGSMFLNTLGLAAVHGAYTTSMMTERLERAPASLPGLEDVAGERLFFYAWCYSLCGRRRSGEALSCNLPLANNAAFAQAFSCPVGSPMNPELKCPV
ncbi:hypothetical protein HPB48_001297 [Haemaphysalis longicornis]|uniref:Uncharacterized protein n=1 Tax=Haemaphysalis longicornis TaxID=44386 RepID=A0A9J6FRW9_HAELO|nr:hypothetical protein HPB48_001297 [Haemaphysalis longicornis]